MEEEQEDFLCERGAVRAFLRFRAACFLCVGYLSHKAHIRKQLGRRYVYRVGYNSVITQLATTKRSAKGGDRHHSG